jgi:hypothetical protein
MLGGQVDDTLQGVLPSGSADSSRATDATNWARPLSVRLIDVPPLLL